MKVDSFDFGRTALPFDFTKNKTGAEIGISMTDLVIRVIFGSLYVGHP